MRTFLGLGSWCEAPAGRVFVGVATIVALIVAARAGAGPLGGVVQTKARPGTAPAPAIVYAEPADGAAPRRPGRFEMLQKGRAFVPAVLAIPVGSTVDFPNRDPIFHNIFSLSPPEPFDLGLYRAGEARSRVFTRPGAYRVFCNIHPEMTAFIAVAPSPWVALADAQGRYRLELPPGRYRLTALSERASPTSIEVVVGTAPADAPPLTLDELQFVAARHKNKFGQDYPASAYGTRKPGPDR